jgi:hypothetical protein
LFIVQSLPFITHEECRVDGVEKMLDRLRILVYLNTNQSDLAFLQVRHAVFPARECWWSPSERTCSCKTAGYQIVGTMSNVFLLNNETDGSQWLPPFEGADILGFEILVIIGISGVRRCYDVFVIRLDPPFYFCRWQMLRFDGSLLRRCFMFHDW